MKEQEEKLLKTMVLNWYKVHNYPSVEHYAPIVNCVKHVSGHCGFVEGRGPSYSDIELFDLRYIDTCTIDELFDKYF
jgi:hypothetical protein